MPPAILPPTFRYGALFLAILCTTACVSTGPEHSAALSETALLTLPGERALPLDAQGLHWLSVGEKSGIQVLTREGRRLSHWPRTAEFLDHRLIETASGSRRLFSSVDTSRGELLLYSVEEDGHALRQEFVSGRIDYAVEGICLHQDRNALLHAFVLDEAFLAHQYLLLPGTDAPWQMLPLRTLPMGPATEFCTVDDASGTLYVSEAGQTLWAQDANPEAELERELIALSAPWGGLGDGPLGLQATARGLHVLSGDGPALHTLSLPSGLQDTQQLTLPAVEALDSIVFGLTEHLIIHDEVHAQFAWLRRAAAPTATATSQPLSELPSVRPSAETTPMPQGGDAADDPAVWINAQAPERSLIIGTNKRQGLFVYALDGSLRQQLDVGRLNNVDVRYGARWQGKVVDLAAASNRDTQALSLFAIDRQSGELHHVTDLPTPLTGIYGLCLHQDSSGQIHAFANDEDGTYLHYTLHTQDTEWTGTLARQFAVGSQPEGCVASDRYGRLYIGEEDVGIWTLGAGTQDSTALAPVAMVGDLLHDDVEGLALYATAEREYLLASSQGNDSYVLFDALAPYAPLGAFRIGMDLAVSPGIDGTSETDGLEIVSVNLGEPYEEGMLVVQDGRNVLPAQHQNFKLVPWTAVRAVVPH